MRIEIFDISAEGDGIGKIDGKVVFVPNAVPGETVEIEIIEDKKRFAKGRRIDIPVDPVCGGCPLIRMDYSAQLAWKEKHVRECLERLGGLENPRVNPIVGMDNPYAYRNKCELRIGVGLPYCNIDCLDCPLQDEKTKEIVKEFRENPTKNAVELVVRTSKTGEFMAYTVQKNDYLLKYSGDHIIHDYIDTDFGRLKVEVDPLSFYQVNALQTGKLYSIAQHYADPTPEDSILDLYCGCGTIGLSMAGHARRVIGVESMHSSILLANRNAVINGIVNTTFVEGKAEDAVKEKLQGFKANIVILDPPRAGCKESLLDTVMELAPEKIVYISCNPSTLARDIARLEARDADGNGTSYRFVEATPVDMFPHTAHVETVVLMSRK